MFPCKTISYWLNFQWQKLFKIQYLSHLRSNNFEDTFLPTPRGHPNFLYVEVFIQMKFQWKNNFIINNFSIIGQNIMKHIQCTPSHWGLSNGTKNVIIVVMIWKTLMWQKKQTTKQSTFFIDRFIFIYVL
jgi:hypothetical protein